jgi:hypothetical protein
MIVVPARRTYRIGSTITKPYGLTMIGIGGRSGQNTAQPATFVWSGASGGTMFDVVVATQNIPCVAFENICLTRPHSVGRECLRRIDSASRALPRP